MHITFVSTYDPQGIRNWSGIPYHINKALTKEFPYISYIRSLREKASWFFKCKQLVYKYFLGKRYLRDREPHILKDYAHQVSVQLEELKPDVIFSVSTIPIAYLESSIPIIVWTDCTFGGMLNFYPEFSNLAAESLRDGHVMEQQALDKCSLIIYSSEWAAQTAIRSYKVNPAKVKVIPFGANVECSLTSNEIKNIINNRSPEICKLLFLGVDWERKGGDIALEVAKELNARGVPTELTVIGCVPPIPPKSLPDFVKPLGFVSKSTEKGQSLIKQKLTESHFLILPTRADCTPIVLSEANSFGVPCLTTNVGGIPSIIKDDINGKAFPINTSIDSYCTYTMKFFLDYERYQQLAQSSFNEYKTRLNWSVASQELRKLIEIELAK